MAGSLGRALTCTSRLMRLVSYALVFATGLWAQKTGLITAILQNSDDIRYLTLQHIELTAISGAIAIVLGTLIGIVLARSSLGPFGPLLAQIVNLGTTIPTLAILALAMTVLGPGAAPAIVGLTSLTLLPVVLNTTAGLRSVPDSLRDAARGMGMTPLQILIQVELPYAMFVILSGVRTALAINIGTVPLAFLIGGGGLGELIFTGIDLMEPGMLLAGAIPTAVLAILVDALGAMAQYWLVPKGINPLR